jgi:hypothetical protein
MYHSGSTNVPEPSSPLIFITIFFIASFVCLTLISDERPVTLVIEGTRGSPKII